VLKIRAFEGGQGPPAGVVFNCVSTVAGCGRHGPRPGVGDTAVVDSGKEIQLNRSRADVLSASVFRMSYVGHVGHRPYRGVTPSESRMRRRVIKLRGAGGNAHAQD
jgi:hypothetical protein